MIKPALRKPVAVLAAASITVQPVLLLAQDESETEESESEASSAPAPPAESPAAVNPEAAAKALKRRTAFINRLNYDLRRNLSVSLQTESIPASIDAFTRSQKRGATIICKKEEVEAGKGEFRSENALLNPSSGVVYPGALVKLDETLAEGMPTPIPIRRAPLRIKIDLPGLGEKGSITIPNPTNVTVGNAIEDAIESWFLEARAGQGYEPAIRAFADSKKAYTNDQISVDMGFGAQWGESWATSNLEIGSNSDNTTIVRTFKQIYYTVNVEEPSEAGAVFADDVVLDREVINAAAPPGLVRSVDYGRFIIVVLNTNNTVKSADARAAMEYVTSGGVNVDADVKAKYEKILQNSHVTVLALGGNANDSMDLFSGDMTTPDAFHDVIRKGLTFDRRNPGLPVSYVTADLKTRATAKMNTTTRYVMTECEEFPSGYIDVKMDGAYVGRFEVSWEEFDDNGKPVAKSWDSGKKTSGYKHRIHFPGDAQNIHVRGIDYTGLVWEPRRAAMDRVLPAITNKCYRISGTTLHPKEEVRDHC